MRMMLAILTTFTFGLSGPDEASAVKMIEIGGTLTRDHKLPGKPVIGMDLRDTQISDADLKHLESLVDLKALKLPHTVSDGVGVYREIGKTRTV
ncbi:MAG: hypothetical protein U0744_20410 [Gemmataceae bacterium]